MSLNHPLLHHHAIRLAPGFSGFSCLILNSVQKSSKVNNLTLFVVYSLRQFVKELQRDLQFHHTPPVWSWNTCVFFHLSESRWQLFTVVFCDNTLTCCKKVFAKGSFKHHRVAAFQVRGS